MSRSDILSSSCGIIKQMSKQSEEKALVELCNDLLEQIGIVLETQNYFPLTIKCTEMAAELKRCSQFSLANVFLEASTNLHELLKIDTSECQFWSSERMSVLCRNFAVMAKTFKDKNPLNK